MLGRMLIGAAVGVLAGGLVGYIAKARGGTCPLTCSPTGGAVFGAVIGAALALSFAAGRRATDFGKGQELVRRVETRRQFEQQVLGGRRPVLVDFYTPACGHCKELAPIFGELAAEYAGRADFVAVNAAEAGEIARAYGISGVPTVILFHEGRERRRWSGVQKADAYRAALGPALKERPAGRGDEG